MRLITVGIAILATACSIKSQTKVDYPTQVKNGPVIIDTAYTNLLDACNAAAAQHASLNITKTWTNVPTTSCVAVVNFVGNSASIQPASSAIFTMEGYTAINRRMVWDTSLNGFVRLATGAAGTTIYAGNFGPSGGVGFAASCDTATAANVTGGTPLVVDAPIAITTSTSCSANISAPSGGVISVSNSAALALAGSFDGDLSQHFAMSGGGTVDLSAATIDRVYPQWFGALCDWNGATATDDTVAIQAAYSAAGAHRVYHTRNCGISGNVYVPASSAGMILEGATMTQQGIGGLIGSGLVAISGSGYACLTILAQNVTLQFFHVNANHICTQGTVAASAQQLVLHDSRTEYATGDGFLIAPEATPTTTMTSNLPSGSMGGTTFTVATAALPGITFGGTNCNALVFAYGTTGQEQVGISASGNTVMLLGTTTFTHNIGTVVRCLGNNDNMQFYNLTSNNNGGWGLDMHPGSDNNGIAFINNQMFSNALGGEVLTGNAGVHVGGHYEQNAGGPAIQMGDTTGGAASPNGTNGRKTVSWGFTPFGDIEGNSPNHVVVVCGTFSTYWLSAISQFDPQAGASACTDAITDIAEARSSDGSGNPVWVRKVALTGGDILNPTLAAWLMLDGSGVVINTVSPNNIAASPQTVGNQITSLLQSWQWYDPNQAVECTGLHTPDAACPGASANNVIVAVLRDANSNLVTIGTNDVRFHIDAMAHTLRSGASANTMTLNGTTETIYGAGTGSATLASGTGANAMLDFKFVNATGGFAVVNWQ